MRQLELDLWGTLKEAATFPELVELEQLWISVELTLESLDTPAQLRVAGEAIAQIVSIVQQRSLLTLEEIDSLMQDSGPVVPADFFDKFVRQSMHVDFAQFIEPPAPLPRRFPCRQLREFPNDGRSIVAIIDKAALLEVLEPDPFDEATKTKVLEDISHHEEISAWVKAISQLMEQRYNSEMVSPRFFLDKAGQPSLEGLLSPTDSRVVQGCPALSGDFVTLKHLQQALGMPLIELWLGMLLGGQDQYKWEQHGEFYGNPDTIFVFN